MAVTAYGALVSLMHIIDDLHHHPSPPIAIDKLQLLSLTQNITFLQELLEGYHFHGDNNHLMSCITKAAYAAEDVIESYIVENIRNPAPTLEDEGGRLGWLAKKFYRFHKRVLHKPSNDYQLALSKKILWIRPCAPRSYDDEQTIFYDNLHKVIKEMELIKKVAMEMTAEKAVVQDLQQQRRPNVSASVAFPGSASTRLNNDTIVGFDEVLIDGLNKLIAVGGVRRVIPIVGMGGIGKTTLAKNLYSKPLVKEHFDICVWVTISQHFNTKHILSEVLSHANKESGEQFVKMSEGEVQLKVHQYLSGRRFLVVMDDMWSIDSWNEIGCCFPDNSNGSRILVTTRLSTIGSQLDSNNEIKMKFLDEDSSWTLFSKTVFGEKTFPRELEEIGKKIVGGCKGLPLSIVVIGGLLRKLEHTRECWESIKKNINSVVNLKNDKHCLKIMKTSYNHLPVHLKPCFLYMGVFEEDSEIRVSILLRLWISEGFLKPLSGKSLETTAKEYFKDLVGRNLLLVSKSKSNGDIKYCKIHDLLRDLCLREAQKEKFYNVMEPHSYPDIHQERRMIFPKSTSKGKLIQALQPMLHARSLICDNWNVQVKPNCALLRSLHAMGMFTYAHREYDDENLLDDMFELVNLRYLAVGVRYMSEFPSTINLLWNLHTIIVYCQSVVDAPAEIWKMPQLRHVHFYDGGVHLPDPPSGNDDIAIMENLQSLMYVRKFKCSKEVVRRIPNIKKLRIQYEGDERIGPCDDEYYCLNNLKSLHKLESFFLYSYTEGDCLHSLTFPQSLQKLTLTGTGTYFDCENVLEKVGSLPLLGKLALDGGLFKTHKWKTVEGEFRSLKFLRLWCESLEEWEMADSSHFPCLEHLVLGGLEQVMKIPSEIGEIPTLRLIELWDCCLLVAWSLKRIVEEQEYLQGEDQLSFHARVWLKLEEEQEEQEALKSLTAPNFEVEWGSRKSPFMLEFEKPQLY